MSNKSKTTIRTDDVVTILDQYKRENTAVAYKRITYAVKALKRFFTGVKVSEIDIPLCREYTYFRLAEGVSKGTVTRELSTLRAACNHAKRWKRLNPGVEPSFEMPRNLPKREIWLFKDELIHLLDNSSDVIHNFTRIAYGTGSRRRAIEELEWTQVNFSRSTINLAKPNEPKTNKRRPTVPMGDLRELLCDLFDEYGMTNRFVLKSNRDLLYDFEKMCKSADLLHVEERDNRPAGKITPHVLRHSRATHLLEDGVSIYAVAKLLGDNPSTIERVYGHVSMSTIEDEISKSTLLT